MKSNRCLRNNSIWCNGSFSFLFFLTFSLSSFFLQSVANFSSAFSILWLTDHNTWSIRSRHCTLYFSGSLALNKEPYLPQGTKPLCVSCPRTSQIELVGEAYQAVHIFIRKCLFMNRPSLAWKISVVWIFYMIVNMKLQYLACMIKVKKQLSNRQPEKTEGALSKHLLPPQLSPQCLIRITSHYTIISIHQ